MRDEVWHRELREVGVGILGEFGLGLRGGQRADPLRCLGLGGGGVALPLGSFEILL
ncbi:hypothetical protein OHA67_32540 [Streptomyces jietaisiensis]|nr:hypothetical protein OHA67_00065 [Streptomyces jietaisiensis]WTI30731.1 hypothetical protein OHA67_32540 [Streptomyces jietaisiensis]